MKKTLFFAAIAALLTCACGSAKQSSAVSVPTGVASPTGVKAVVAEGSACYKMQEEKPAIRSVGSGTNFKESFAKQRAITQAQAEYATKIQAAVEAACEEVGVSLEQYASDGKTGAAVTDQSAEGGNLASMVAKQNVKNTTVIKTERYVKEDGQYLVYVCIEYAGDLSELVSEVEDGLKEQISEADRAKLEARHDKFRKRVETKMNSL